MVLKFQRMVSPTVLNTPTVLMLSPRFIMISPTVLSIPTILKIIPTVLMISPTVLNTPRYSRFPPTVLNTPTALKISRQGTEHPHSTAHTLYRVSAGSGDITSGRKYHFPLCFERKTQKTGKRLPCND